MRFLGLEIVRHSLPLQEKVGFFSKWTVNMSIFTGVESSPMTLPSHSKGAAETFEEVFCCLVLCYEILSVATDTIRVAPWRKAGKIQEVCVVRTGSRTVVVCEGH